MKPGTFERRQDPASGREDASSPNQREVGVARDEGFSGVADEELEFFDTVGVEPHDAMSFAGVRVRH